MHPDNLPTIPEIPMTTAAACWDMQKKAEPTAAVMVTYHYYHLVTVPMPGSGENVGFYDDNGGRKPHGF